MFVDHSFSRFSLSGLKWDWEYHYVKPSQQMSRNSMLILWPDSRNWERWNTTRQGRLKWNHQSIVVLADIDLKALIYENCHTEKLFDPTTKMYQDDYDKTLCQNSFCFEQLTRRLNIRTRQFVILVQKCSRRKSWWAPKLFTFEI